MLILITLSGKYNFAKSNDTTRKDMPLCTDSLFFDGYYKEVFVECGQMDTLEADFTAKAFGIKKDFFLNCNWPPFSSGYKYYTTRKRSKYCFKIYEISGWFIKLTINTEAKRDALDWRLRYVPNELEIFNAWFFRNYKTYSNNPVSLKGKIYLWKEVPPVFK